MRYENIDKIKWEYIGMLTKKQKVYGKEANIRMCPTCDNRIVHLHKSKGRFKIVCPKCHYENIQDSYPFKEDKRIIFEGLGELK
jgi:hypothetical protein